MDREREERWGLKAEAQLKLQLLVWYEDRGRGRGRGLSSEDLKTLDRTDLYFVQFDQGGENVSHSKFFKAKICL